MKKHEQILEYVKTELEYLEKCTVTRLPLENGMLEAYKGILKRFNKPEDLWNVPKQVYPILKRMKDDGVNVVGRVTIPFLTEIGLKYYKISGDEYRKIAEKIK